MKKILEKALFAIEKRLRDRGFTVPETRRIVARQLLLTGIALPLGCAALPFSLWPLGFALGAVIASANVYFTAAGAKQCLALGAGAIGSYIGMFLLRFVATGAALYMLLAVLFVPAIPLLAGLSTVVFSLMLLGVTRAAGNSRKEA